MLWYPVHRQRLPSSAERTDLSSRAHQRIAQAILDGDADTAEQRMRRHVQAQITNVRQTRPEMLDELIDWR